MCDNECNYIQTDPDQINLIVEMSLKDVIIKQGSIVCTNNKTLGYVKEDYLVPQKKIDVNEFSNLLKDKIEKDESTENGESITTAESIDSIETKNPNMVDIIVFNTDEVQSVDHTTNILYVFNKTPEGCNSNYSFEVKSIFSLLELAQETMKFFTFRKKDRLLKRISNYDNEEFFYGFTTSAGLYHSDFCNYKSVYNMPRLTNLPSSLYYQAGDYGDPMLAQGCIEITDCYNKKEHGAVGDLMCGYASDHEKGPRFIRWFYCGQAFYNMWLLFMFSHEYYIFKGASKKEIIDRLYDDSLPNPHLYQAYAHVIYYNEPIPDEYELGNLAELITDNLIQLITPTF